MFYGAGARNPDGTEAPRVAATWPRRDAANVDTGQTLGPLRLQLINVPPDKPLRVTLGGVDCDGNRLLLGVLNFGGIVPGMEDFSRGVLGQRCSGEEEVFEASGRDDRLGLLSITLTPEQWQRGGVFALQTASRSEDCSATNISHSNPFTANVRISAAPRRRVTAPVRR